MRFEKVIQLGIPVLCGALALLLGLNFLLLVHTQTNMHQSVEFERTILEQARQINTSEPEKLVARFAALRDPADARAAARSFETLQAALATWPGESYRDLVGPPDDIKANIAAILRNSKSLQGNLDNLEGSVTAGQVLAGLQVVGDALEQINRRVYQEVSGAREAARDRFRFHQILQSGLVLSLLLSMFAWLCKTYSRNAKLKAAVKENSERTDQLALQLSHDRVTGLINHRVFADQVSAAAGENLADGQTLNIFNICLDTRLPARNTCSQATEEALLVAIADLLRHAVDRFEAKTCLARSPGKGFLLMAVSDREIGQSAAVVAERIHDIFLRPVQTPLGTFLISPAIGYADSLTSDGEPPDIIANAGLAVANADECGHRQVIAYVPSMRAVVERKAIVETALARAIEADECLPHFQPQFNLKTGRIFGVEALARWYHSELGWISPSEFIPIAEGNGDIVSLGWKILETSCSEVQLLPTELSLSVNLSVAQILSDDVVGMMDECLSRTGLPASRLKLEVTESTLMSDLKRIQATLSDLRALGVGISLDDFGIGYSALSYLTDFHWDEIKIDRSFAIKAVKDRKMRDILKMVLGIAETMGSTVIIEGIETVEQRDVLVDLGCTNGQGYLFGGPMAIDDITTLFFNDEGQQNLAGI